MSSPGATVVGRVMGTPAYMPPEQARGEAVDERADVYALGALLYHVLAGCSPFAQDVPTMTEGDTVTGGPGLARAIVPLDRRQLEVPIDLLTVVNKAMAPDAADRYPTAQELAADLKRFQTGQLVSAHRYSAWTLAGRWLRRHRALVALGAVALLVLAGLGALSVSRIVREREVAEAQRREAQRRGAEAEARTNELILLQARAALATDPTASLAWLKLYPATAPSWDRARAIATDAFSRGVARRVLRGHTGSVQALAFSPDGATVASGGTDERIRLWHRDGTVTELASPGAVGGLAYAPDGRRLVSTVERSILTWDLDGGTLRPRTLGSHEGAVTNIAFAPDGATLTSVSMDHTVRMWQMGGGDPVILRGDGYASWGVAYSPDGARLITGSAERDLRIWDAAKRTSWTVTNPEPFGPIAVSPDGDTVALAGATGVHLWSLADQPPTHRALPRQSDYVLDLAFSPDGEHLATGNSGGSVRIWELATATSLTLHGHDGHVVKVTYARDGSELASAGDDATVRVWAIAELGDGGRALRGLARPTSYPRLLSDGHRVAVGGLGRIAIWDLDGRSRRMLGGAGGEVSALDALADGRLVARADDGIRIWDPASDEPGRSIWSQPVAGELLSVSSRGDVLVLSTSHDAALVIDPVSGQLRCRFAGQAMWSALFSPDGSRVAFVDGDRIMLGDLAGCTSRMLYHHGAGVISLAFAPDGRHLASVVDSRVALWSADTDSVRMLEGHTQIATEVAFSPDGATVATAGVDRTVRLWAVATGAPGAVLTGPTQAVRSLIFVDDGRIAAAADDGSVRLWILGSDDVRVLRSQADAAPGLVVSRDHRWLVATTRDAVRVWAIDRGGLPPAARGPAGLAAWLDQTTSATIGADDQLRSP
jgi:WD40 repeat protein